MASTDHSVERKPETEEGKEVEGKEVEGKEVEGKEVEGKEVEGKEVKGKEVKGKEVDREEVGDATVKEVLTALDQVGSEWRLRVLAALHGGEHRFNDLKRATDASSSTLSRVLEDLEDLDLVERRVEDRPIATYYSLTGKGAALCPVWEAMAEWSAEWVACETIEEIEE